MTATAQSSGGGLDTDTRRDLYEMMVLSRVFETRRAGQPVKAGMIIVRQRGTRFRPGPGTALGRDDTIFALREGRVEFRRSGEKRFISVGE